MGATRSTGSAQANDLDGQGANDSLRGGQSAGPDGADVFVGGTGTGDAVSYQARTDDLDVDIGGGANDGASCPGGGCEGDNVGVDVETLTGGAGDDDLTGDADANVLNGNSGDDLLRGNSATTADAADGLNGGGDGTAGGQNGANGDIVSYAARTASGRRLDRRRGQRWRRRVSRGRRL